MSRTRIRWTTKLRAERAARRSIDGDEYARVSPASLGLNKGPRIAVIYAAGAITSGKSGYDPVNGAGRRLRYAHRLHPRRRARDSAVRAIVLRIDSPADRRPPPTRSGAS